MRIRKSMSILAAAGIVLVGCTAGSSDDSASTGAPATAAPDTATDTAADTTEAAQPADTTATTDSSPEATTAESSAPPETFPTGPAPGVTDDAIKVGITYVDLKAIGDVASLNHGDYELAYRAVIDDINANGGINGRTIEPVFAPVNPIGTEPAEAACVQLTQDEQVFAVIGFVSGEAVLCPLETHPTAVIGGSMNDEYLARAQAPWFTAEAGSDLMVDVVTKMADSGVLDGTVGVFGGSTQEALINDTLLPLLEANGVNVAETAIVDQTGEADITASNAQVAVIAERFRGSGVDQVLAIAETSLAWANGIESSDYRPQLFVTDPGSLSAYINDQAGRDMSVVEGSIAGGLYGPAQAIWELPAMQECIKIVEAAGEPVPAPETIPTGEGSVYVAGTTACTNIGLFQALAEAAGPDLNYGSLVGAADGLEVQLRNQPVPVTYGPPPSADGDLPAFLFTFDPATKRYIILGD